MADERHTRGGNGKGARAQWDPHHGWAVPVPATTPRAYIGGDAALNVPALADDADRGDWHEYSTWWSATPTKADGTSLEFERWGPDGDTAGAPSAAEVRDARPAMALIAHPSARNADPIYAATVVQAILDVAWDALTTGLEPPDRRETFTWLSDAGEAHARKRAEEVEEQIADEALRARWRTWRENALEGDDPFYDTSPAPRKRLKPTARIRIEIVAR